MKLSVFTAENANDAVQLVQKNLGPEAVITSVRKLPASGLARLLQRAGQIEVTACVPEKPRHAVPAGVDAYVPFEEKLDAEMELPPPRAAHRWRSVTWLESLGLLPGAQRRRGHRPSARLDRAAGCGQDHGAVQMADERRAARRTSRADLAAGWRDGKHGGISFAALRNDRRRGGTLLERRRRRGRIAAGGFAGRGRSQRGGHEGAARAVVVAARTAHSSRAQRRL